MNYRKIFIEVMIFIENVAIKIGYSLKSVAVNVNDKTSETKIVLIDHDQRELFINMSM